MASTPRMQGLQDDLLNAARDLETLSQALSGHARYLHHSVHKDDAQTLDGHAQNLQETACEMRDIAATITP